MTCCVSFQFKLLLMINLKIFLMKSLSKKVLYLLFAAVFVGKLSPINAQVLNTGLFEPEYSKEVLKAKKKGDLLQLGYFGEATGEKFYFIAAYKPKKAENYTLLIHTFDEQGKEIGATSYPMSESKKELEKLNLRSLKINDKTTIEGLKKITEKYNGKEVATIKSPTLAGKPTIEKGKFQPIFMTIGDSKLLERFDFVLSSEQKIDERFWCSVTFPVDEDAEVFGKSDYLLNEKEIDMNSFQTVGKMFRDYKRSSMLPIEETAYIGGVKATNEMTTFISGTMDLKTGQWQSKYEIETIGKTGGRKHNKLRLADGNTVIQLPLDTKKDENPGFILLTVDKTGKEVNQTKITFEANNDKRMYAQNGILKRIDEDSYFNISTLTTINLTKPYLAISRSVGSNESVNEVYNIEQLAESAILPPNLKKFKAKKIKGYTSTQVKEVGKSYLIIGEITIGPNEKYNTIIDINNECDVNAMYIYPRPTYPDMKFDELPFAFTNIKSMNELEVSEYKSPDFKKIHDGEYYIVDVMKTQVTEKGIAEESTLLRTDFLGTKTFEVDYFRVDYDRTFVGVTRINFENKSISNTVVPAALINGDSPGIVIKNKALFLDSDNKLVIVK